MDQEGGRKSWTPEPIDGKDRYEEFRILAEYALGLLDEEEKNLLKIRAGDRSLDFAERLVSRRWWDRYLPPEGRKVWEQKKEGIKWVLDRLGFLFGSGVPEHIVGHLVTETILDATTLGSQVWHLRAKTLEWRGRRRGDGLWCWGSLNVILKFRLQHPCIGKFNRYVPMLQERYPQMTPEDLIRDLGRRGLRVCSKYKRRNPKDWEHFTTEYEQFETVENEFTLFEQMIFRYSYYLFKVYREGNHEAWFKGILQRHRWHLEKMALSNGAWNQNKCREDFLRLISEELTGDAQRSKFQDCVFLFKGKGQKEVTIDKDEGAERIIEAVLGCFGEEQLRLLKSKDSRGNPWSFEQQMQDRFSYRRPSFASMEEIGEHVRRKVSMYGPLITEDTAAVIGDILLDDFDRELFVSEATYRWNQEMEKKLEGLREKFIGSNVRWSVDRILESIDAPLLEKLPRNLKTLLLSRWKRARLAGSRRRFQRFLDELHIHTIHCPRYWSKENLSEVDLQAFMGQLDPMFLYPRPGRIFKLLGNRNDVGLSLGKRRDGRYLPLNALALAFGFLTVMAIIIGASVSIVHEVSNPEKT